MAGKGASGGVALTENDGNTSTKDGERGVRQHAGQTCHRCLEPDHRWFDCTAHVISAAKKSQNGSGKVIGCLAIDMLGKRDAVGGRKQSKDGTDEWIADSGAAFNMTRSADLLRDLYLSEYKV